MATKILVVDDEADLREILEFNLRSEGYDVDTADSAEKALGKEIETYDLFILDVMMGNISGFKLADIIKSEKEIEVPIIFLTAKDAENDLLTGFSLGADDYIRKPFSIVELKARVKAVISRSRTKKNENEVNSITIGELCINSDRKAVTLEEQTVELTKTEYLILELLVANLDRYLSRNEILNGVWNDTIVSERTVDVHVARLRKRLGSFGTRLKSKTGYGYYLDIQDI